MASISRRGIRPWAETSGSGVPHPRGGENFQTMPAERQQAAHAAMDRMHAEAIPKMDAALSSEIGELRGTLHTKRGSTDAKLTRISSLESAREELSQHPGDAMQASVNRVTATAMAPVHAARAQAKQTGVMSPVLAGEFYGLRHQIGKHIADQAFGEGSDKSLRAQLAMPEFSARSTPQQEVRGGAGMVAMLKHGDDIHFDIGHRAARVINDLRGGSGGAVPLEEGRYSFNELSEQHPQATSLLLQHHAKERGLVAASSHQDYTPERLAVMQGRQAAFRKGTSLDLPPQLEGAAAALVSGYGDVGFPKGGRALARFHADPETFGGHMFHKIPSYTWNIHQHDEVMAAGTHHFLGMLTHGKHWLAENPDAPAAIAAAKQHPAWSDPTSTMDVWSGRVASGLPFHALPVLGKDRTNPDMLLKNQVPGRQKGERYGTPSDMGYFWGEEAHRQASRSMSVNVPGVGRTHAPAHVVQSLSWYGVQGEENANQVRMGNRTLVPDSPSDPRSLNALSYPQTYVSNTKRSQRR